MYGEGITRSKLIQLHKQKDQQLQTIRDKGQEERFTKQYPTILHTLFGRSIYLVSYKHDTMTEIQLLSQLLSQIINREQEVTEEHIETIVDISPDESLTETCIRKITEHYPVGICLVTNLVSKLLQHDVFVSIPRDQSDNPELPMILLYQTPSSMIHIQRKNEMFPFVGELQSPLFKKYI